MDRDWNKILEKIKEELDSHNFKIWFSKTQLGGISDHKITLKAPSAFVQEQLIKRYDGLIKETAKKVTGKALDVAYFIDSSLDTNNSSLPDLEPFEFGTPPPANIPSTGLNPKYTLESFVVGLTNNLAFAAAQAVVKNPGTSYNPLFIYGPSGVGKTHLMQAIGNALLRKGSHAKLLSVSSERFVNDHVASIQNKKTADFRNRYRSAGILLMDDVQFIAGKDSTQEEFFHTFNELHSKNTQIVLTSDCSPSDMEKLEDRLRSRFQGGLMVDIQLPDFETRVAILKSKLAQRQESLPEDCLHLIAENVASNARELEGKLSQILQAVRVNGKAPDIEVIRPLLGTKEVVSAPILNQKKVLETVNRYFNLKMADLIGPRRQKELVLPRQIAMYLLYTQCKIPMAKVGVIIGGRDHTTILHGVKKMRQAITRDREVQRLLVEVNRRLST